MVCEQTSCWPFLSVVHFSQGVYSSGSARQNDEKGDAGDKTKTSFFRRRFGREIKSHKSHPQDRPRIHRAETGKSTPTFKFGKLQGLDAQPKSQRPQPSAASRLSEPGPDQLLAQVLRVGVTAGRLKYFLPAWERLTWNKFILNCIRGYKLSFINEPVQTSVSTAPVLKKSQSLGDVRETIVNLFKIGAVRVCSPTQDQFLPSYLLVKKFNGSFRFMLNLKKLNEFIVVNHFKMEDGRTATRLMCLWDFFMSIDLENAYFLVSTHPSCGKFPRFIFKGSLFEFACLHFGLNVAALIFTKIMKPVVS